MLQHLYFEGRSGPQARPQFPPQDCQGIFFASHSSRTGYVDACFLRNILELNELWILSLIIRHYVVGVPLVNASARLTAEFVVTFGVAFWFLVFV